MLSQKICYNSFCILSSDYFSERGPLCDWSIFLILHTYWWIKWLFTIVCVGTLGLGVLSQKWLRSFLHFEGILSLIRHFFPIKSLVVSALHLLESVIHFNVFIVWYEKESGCHPWKLLYNHLCISKNLISYLSSFLNRWFLNGGRWTIRIIFWLHHCPIYDCFEVNMTNKAALAISRTYCHGHDRDNCFKSIFWSSI